MTAEPEQDQGAIKIASVDDYDRLGLGAPLNSIAWSPSGKFLVTLRTDGRWVVWTWPGLEEVSSGSAVAVAWDHSERLTISTGDDVRQASFEPSTRGVAPGRILLRGAYLAIQWSPDGKWLAGASSHRLVVWAANARSADDFVVLEGQGPFAFGPRRLLAHGSGDSLVVCRFDTTQAMRVATFELGAPLTHVAWSHDGSLLIAASRHGLRCLHPQTKAYSVEWELDRPDVASLGLAPNSKLLALAFGSQRGLRDPNHPVPALIEWTSEVSSFDVQFHPHERTLAWAQGRSVTFTRWNEADTEATTRASSPIQQLPAVPPPGPPTYPVDADDVPLLVHHLVLTGCARPELLQDFAVTQLRDAIARALSPLGDDRKTFPDLLSRAKSARQPPDVWLAWVRTVRAKELGFAAKELRGA